MNIINRSLGAFVALLATVAMVPAAFAAYPKSIKVAVEVWNDEVQNLQMTYASWKPQGTGLSTYHIQPENSGKGFSVTLGNPRSDSATMRYAAAGGKKCEFTFSHKATFSWIGISPAPEKFATAKSVGTASAECGASVTKGTNSMESYTVRFSMK